MFIKVHNVAGKIETFVNLNHVTLITRSGHHEGATTFELDDGEYFEAIGSLKEIEDMLKLIGFCGPLEE